jgi:carbamoyltransferase
MATHILGISCFYHDSAACLVTDGEIVAAAQEERFTRRKHDDRFPAHAIRFCLERAGVSADELNVVAFYDKPFVKFERILETYLSFAPRGLPSYVKALPLWLKRKLWIPDLISKELGSCGRIVYPEHHESHAASAFFPSPFPHAAFLTMDGVGEWTTTSYGLGEGNRIRILADIRFPHSLGLLYSAFTYFTGFKVNSGEYKLMGLAPYGEPKYVRTMLEELIDVKQDGSFRLNLDYFDYCAGLRMTSGKFERLFGGPPRKREGRLTQREMDLARSVQEVTELVMLRAARHVAKETGERYLCLAGGVALNCVANGKILREGLFDDIWIQPAAGDAGGALGAALLTWYQLLGHEREVTGKGDTQKGSYLGPEFGDAEIRSFLEQEGAPYRECEDGEIPGLVADLVAGQKVVGWFQGRMEFGPRALGARSILGDARSPKMQRLINLKIKFRESFRPFAPSVLEERAGDYFDIDRPSPYMLLVAPVSEAVRYPVSAEDDGRRGLEKLGVVRSSIPAITHVDCSARLQTVAGKDNALYHGMLKALETRTGCPVIINTSFNVRGEPIVCTPEDAYRCFMRTNMDRLVMGRYLLCKEEQPGYDPEREASVEQVAHEYELD